MSTTQYGGKLDKRILKKFLRVFVGSSVCLSVFVVD